MKTDIDKLTEQELIELNHKIVERIKFLQSMHTEIGNKIEKCCSFRKYLIK